jgi:hypothetical protein
MKHRPNDLDELVQALNSEELRAYHFDTYVIMDRGSLPITGYSLCKA